jgi:hypothetical protein
MSLTSKEWRQFITIQGGHLTAEQDRQIVNDYERLEARLTSQAPGETAGLREVLLAVKAMRALAASIHARAPGQSQTEDDSREIVSMADRACRIADATLSASTPTDGGLRKRLAEAHCPFCLTHFSSSRGAFEELAAALGVSASDAPAQTPKE